MGLKQDLGLTRGQADETFDKIWNNHGFSKVSKGDVVRTAPIQSLYEGKSDRQKEQIKNYKGMVRHSLGAQAEANSSGKTYEKALESVQKNAAGEPQEKIMDAGEVEGPTPLVFDPEILSILKETSPLLEIVPQEGQEGYKAVYNRIDSREPAIGHVTEGQSLQLLSQANDVNLDKNEVDMAIYVDVAEISDFSQAASEHYMNVEETTLAQRIQEHAVDKARKMLYAAPQIDGYADSSATNEDPNDGSLYDGEVYDGMVDYFERAGNQVDKTGFSGTVVEDVKAEIADLEDEVSVMKPNLVAYTSNSLEDYMSNEVDERARHDSSDTEINFGLQNIRINGTPVVGGHQVERHDYDTLVQSTSTGSDTITVRGDLTATGGDGDRFVSSGDDFELVTAGGSTETLTVDTITTSTVTDAQGNQQTESTVAVTQDLTSDRSGETASFQVRGDRGDVFIFSTRSMRFRALAPLSTVPLAKEGLSENVAMYEFGALVSKAEGAFGKHLSAYPQV